MAKFKTLKQQSEGLYKEKGSKFIAYAYPILSTDEIKPIVEELKEIHPKSRHVCFAFRLGLDGNDFRANDDGEPSGTAGKPILGQIDSFEITNVFIAIVRYFGGTKLGVPGLIHAYKTAAQDAIENNKIIEEEERTTIQFTCSYSNFERVKYLLQKVNAQEQKVDYDSLIKATFLVPLDELETAKSLLKDWVEF